MSNGVKISNLTSAAALDGTEQIPVVQSGTTVKATAEQLKTLAQTNVPAANITGTLPVANGGTGVTTSTGTGSVVLSTSPTLVTPALGTPSSGVLTNATGLPIATGVSGLGTGVATFLATPSSANLAAAVTNETGSGALVFASSPTLVAPVLGTVAAGSILTNATGLPISTGVSGLGTGIAAALAVNTGSAGAPVLLNGVLGTPSSGTLTNGTGLPISTGVSGLGAGIATFLGTPSSANLAAAVTDETGTGALVFATSPTLVTPVLGTVAAGSVLTNATGLPLTTGVTGTLPIANGGTGQTTANTAFNALAPSQTSQSSKFLTTDGTNTSWASPIAAAASVTIGTTTVISGTSGYILYNNAGVLGNLATTGTGSVVLSTSPTLVTPALGVATGTSLALGGATIGSNALAVTGASALGLLGVAGAGTAADRALVVGMAALTGTTIYGAVSSSNIPATVTAGATIYYSGPSTAASAFTLPSLRHYSASSPATFGAGSTVTSQFGFIAESTLTGATNNYGFYGNIASGSNRWNLYMAGTANNYMAGSLGIGSTALTGFSLRLGRNITGATTSYGVAQATSVQSDVTSAAYAYYSDIGTQAASFTLGALVHYHAAQGVIGVSSAVTSQYGFNVASGLTGATNNFGFYGDIPSGTNRWNLYMAGTAANYLGGTLAVGGAAIGSNALAVTGTANISGATTIGGAINYGGVTLSNSVTGTGSMVLSASPTFTGTPAAPTASPGTNTTQVATTAYADALVSAGRVRAWVNFAGATGTVNASGNVTSVTRITTGTYVVNLTSAIPANAAWSYGSYAASSANFTMLGQVTAQTTTTSPRVAVATIAGVAVDPDTAWLTAIA